MSAAQKQLIAFRKALAMSRKAFANWLGRDHGRSVLRWESGRMPVPPELERLIAVINNLPSAQADEAIELIAQMGRRK